MSAIIFNLNDPVILYNKQNEPFSLSTITEVDSNIITVLGMKFSRIDGFFLNDNSNKVLIKWKPISPMEKSMKYPYYKDITSRIELFDIELLNKNESLEDYENRVIREPLLKKLTKRHHVEQLKNRLNNINIQRNEIINQIKNLANS